MEGGNDAGGYEIDPDPDTSFFIGVRGEKKFGRGEGIFEELADHGAFVEGFIIVFEGWDEAAGI